MKIVLIGGGEPGLHLLSWLCADPATEVPVVVEPNRDALIYQVERMGFRWGETVSGAQPPVLRESVDAIADVTELGLVVASAADDALLAQVRATAARAGVPVLTPDDLALCDHLRRAIGFKPGGEAVGSGPDQAPAEIGVTGDQLEALLERLLQGAPWPVLLERMTWFVQWLCGAPMGALFVYRGWGRSLLFERERGMAACGVGERLLFRGAAQRAIDELYIVQVTGRDRVGQGTEVVALPLLLDERPVGALVLALPERGARIGQRGCFALSWLAIALAGLLSRGLQMEWTRESVLRDQIRRGIKEIIGSALPAAEACRQGVELIADQLAAASCRLYCRGPLAAGWVTAASAPAAQTARAQDEHPWEGTVMLTAASLEPLLLVQRPSNLAALTSANGGVGLLHLSFSLGPQGDGVLVIEHHGAQSWSVQLVELLKEMGQLLGSVTRRVVHREGSPRVAEGPA